MITHVAIRTFDGRVWKLPPPDRHGHVIFKILFEKGRLPVHIQGFVNDKGEFLDRKEAFFEALRCNQVLPPYNPVNPKERRGEIDTSPRELFSENLW